MKMEKNIFDENEDLKNASIGGEWKDMW